MSTPQNPDGLLAAISALAEKLEKRADWLDREIKAGGNIPYLAARRAECQYITQLVRGLPNDAALVRR